MFKKIRDLLKTLCGARIGKVDGKKTIMHKVIEKNLNHWVSTKINGASVNVDELTIIDADEAVNIHIDADLTVPSEELLKLINQLTSGKIIL